MKYAKEIRVISVFELKNFGPISKYPTNRNTRNCFNAAIATFSLLSIYDNAI